MLNIAMDLPGATSILIFMAADSSGALWRLRTPSECYQQDVSDAVLQHTKRSVQSGGIAERALTIVSVTKDSTTN